MSAGSSLEAVSRALIRSVRPVRYGATSSKGVVALVARSNQHRARQVTAEVRAGNGWSFQQEQAGQWYCSADRLPGWMCRNAVAAVVTVALSQRVRHRDVVYPPMKRSSTPDTCAAEAIS